MKKLFLLVVLLVPVFSFAQCKFEASKSVSDTYPPIPDENKVIMYSDKSDAPKEAVIVGSIICNGDNEQKIIPAAKKLAAEHGANGIYYSGEEVDDKGKKGLSRFMTSTKLYAVYTK